jgi:formylglycine-generating enzyme required for sulfatase activity
VLQYRLRGYTAILTVSRQLSSPGVPSCKWEVDMPSAFDPYHRWLAIPPKDQPPNHYRLLAIDASESDAEVIRDAAEQRMAHVRTYGLGRYSELSQRILNELAAAKACLLDPKSKAAYDRELSAQSGKPDVATQLPPPAPQPPLARHQDTAKPIAASDPLTSETPPPPPAIDGDFRRFIENVGHAPSPKSRRLKNFLTSRSRKSQWTGASLVAVAFVLLLGVILLIGIRHGVFKEVPGQGKVSGIDRTDQTHNTPREKNERADGARATVPTPPTEHDNDAAAEDITESDLNETDMPTLKLPAVKPDSSVALMHGAGETITNEKDGSQLVLIPPGKFLAGKEEFEVSLPAYCIGRHEVTNRQYKRFIDATGHRPPGIAGARHPVWQGNRFRAAKANHPVVGVDWQDAKAYCDWAGLRLPRELEWEKAARGVHGRQFPWGEQWEPLDRCRNRMNRGSEQTCEVAAYPRGASPWGIMHMAGNAAEWTADWASYGDFTRYKNGIVPSLASGQGIVVRGDSWLHDDADCFRCWARHNLARPDSRNIDLGFRVAKSVSSVVDKAEEKVPAPAPRPTEAKTPAPLEADAPKPSELPDGGAFESRSPAARSKILSRAGGNKQSEKAVERGLRWLAAHQRNDGSWCFDLRKPPCNGMCRNSGSEGSTTAATGLALLPFLGAGYTQTQGEHRETVKRGLYYLSTRAVVTPQGLDLRDGGTMYGQGIATIALCEAYGMTRDQSLKEIAQGAVRFIVDAQDPNGGGWRYKPRDRGDTSVTGWQLTALRTGQMARLQVPSPTISLVQKFLDGVQYEQGAQYGYLTSKQGDSGPEAMTAVGLLCRMYTGWSRDRMALFRGIGLLHRWGPSQTNLYYDYYATQVLRHWDRPNRPEWRMWNRSMRDHLVVTQSSGGHEAGSWHFPDRLGDHGGRLYNTAMAIMILEVYYRDTPLYDKKTGPRRQVNLPTNLSP